MAELYRVAIHYNEEIGFLEYNETDKTANVVLAVAEKKAEVEAYLAAAHEIRVPKDSLMDFSITTVQPLCSLESFKLALTRLWGITGVYVDWSRPVSVG